MSKRIISLVLCTLCMGFIFYNSSQSSYKSNVKSKKIINKITNTIKDNSSNSNKNENIDNSINNEIADNSSNENNNSSDNKESEDRNEKIENSTSSKLNFIVRKSAHAIEYLILSILLLLALSTFKLSIKSINIYVLSIILLYGLSDEFHQLFVPGRNGRLEDVAIDFIGGLIGLIIYYAVRKHPWGVNFTKYKHSKL